VLLDLRMPVVDGVEFARRYRRTPAPHAPLVVLSAEPDGAVRAARIGAADYLAKPFDLTALIDAVGRQARRSA
jgi:CheY-like chemotaxis protein